MTAFLRCGLAISYFGVAVCSFLLGQHEFLAGMAVTSMIAVSLGLLAIKPIRGG